MSFMASRGGGRDGGRGRVTTMGGQMVASNGEVLGAGSVSVSGGRRGGGGGSRVVDGRISRGIGGGRGVPIGAMRDMNMDALCREICRILKEDQKVNFLALDFDLTIVDIHTSGRWPGTPEQLAQRIRPFFRALIPAALTHGLYLGVVTFSPQVSMISKVLKAAFPNVASQIPIRGDDFSWDYEGRGATEGKQSHMASAVEELTQTHAASITRASTLLIDDDVNNVEIALNQGVKSIWCDPKNPDGMMTELLNLSNDRDSSSGGVLADER